MLGGLATGYFVLLTVVQVTAISTRRHIERVQTSLGPASSALDEAEGSFVRVKKEYHDAVLLEDPGALKDAAKAIEDVSAALEIVRRNLGESPELAKSAEELQGRFARLSGESKVTYGGMLASKDNMSDDLQTQAAWVARENVSFGDSMQSLDERLATEARGEFAAVNSASVHDSLIGWVVLGLALLGCGLAWWALHQQVLEPLERLARRMQGIAEGDGDLTARVPVRAGDGERRNELDEVGHWFNVFIGRIEQIVVRVMENAAALGEAAESLAGTARETASQSEQQQEEAKRITSSMGEISTAVREISETTKHAAVDAHKAEDNAHTGGATIDSTVKTIQQLLAANQATAMKIEELGKASDAIGKIIHVIDDIADQTNLLALNASIESARAGEHGRGFAVVALEVRRLAERTSLATKEIDATVCAIQSGTAEVVEAMRGGLSHAQSGVSAAQSTGEVLASIIRGSESLQVMVTQIANASDEQSAATRSVEDNINEIVRLGERTITSSATAVEACDHLSELAGDLNALVGSFKVRGEGSVGERKKYPQMPTLVDRVQRVGLAKA